MQAKRDERENHEKWNWVISVIIGITYRIAALLLLSLFFSWLYQSKAFDEILCESIMIFV
jgi:hypothetical protein